MTYRCFECGDLGFIVEKNARRLCWRRNAPGHSEPGAAARILERAVERLMVRQLVIDAQHFEIAKLLTRFTAEAPFDRARTLEHHFTMPLRTFHQVIEDLRRIWLLPVGSSKFKPHGYWICTTEEEFARWIDHCRAAPITQLSMISAVARHNFPIFAEQLELEFWQDIHGSDAVRQMSTASP